MKKRPSSTSTELQIWTPEKKREPSRRMDLAIVPFSHDSPFTLPEGWVVEKRRRTHGMLRGTVDKYYREPETGRTLRSLASVRKYVTEPGLYEITSRGDIKPKMQQTEAMPLSVVLPPVQYKSKSRVIPSSSKRRSAVESLTCKSADNIVAYWRKYIPKHQVNIDRSKPLKLPHGWFIKRITRMSGQSMGRVDKYYCERATGRVFRSRLEVLRYMADSYKEENTTLSELFKPAGLIQMSRSVDEDVDEESPLAIVPHSGNKESYSNISDDVQLKDLEDGDVPLKYLVRKSDYMPLKNSVQKTFDQPLKDLVRKSNDRPHVQESDVVALEDVCKSDDVPLKDLLKKSPVGRKPSKNPKKVPSPKKNVASCTTKTNTCPVNVSNPLMKIKWVLSGPGGDAWSPFINDTMVAKSLKQEWSQMFMDIVSQKPSETSSSDGQE